MHTILCYGDSNTWGWDAQTRQRFDLNTRWPGVMRNELGSEFWVVEEGLNGRTTVWDDPIEGDKNGKRHLLPILNSHKPIDLVILMLGTNDLKVRFSVPPEDIAQSIDTLVGMIFQSATGPRDAAPGVLIVVPPPTRKAAPEWRARLAGAQEKSARFAPLYKAVAAERGCDFVDAGETVSSSEVDGIHWDAASHRAFGIVAATAVRRIFSA